MAFVDYLLVISNLRSVGHHRHKKVWPVLCDEVELNELRDIANGFLHLDSICLTTLTVDPYLCDAVLKLVFTCS